MSRKTIAIEANSRASVKASRHDQLSKSGNAIHKVASELASHSDSLLFTGGTASLCLLVAVVAYAPALVPLLFLGFAVVCIPYRVASFIRLSWGFFLVDFCYFANVACVAFLLLAPEDPRAEAALYVLCEGPLAAALLAWQCAWLQGSPNHIISVLIHLLPGLALFCHRYLSPSRQPLALLGRMGAALAGAHGADPWATTQIAGGSACPGNAAASFGGGSASAAGILGRLATAGDIARGRVACPNAAAATAAASAVANACAAFSAVGNSAVGAGSVACYAQPAAPPRCPAPSWMWLCLAPLAFYAAWQLVYFLVVQVACRRLILSRGYETSYRSLTRRAQRAQNGLSELVRSGGTARRLIVYGLLQLAFSVVTGALAGPTYHYFGAALVWQLVKLAAPIYLGACQQCQRLPAQQLRAAAAKLVAAGLLAPEALGPATAAAPTGGCGAGACEAEKTAGCKAVSGGDRGEPAARKEIVTASAYG